MGYFSSGGGTTQLVKQWLPPGVEDGHEWRKYVKEAEAAVKRGALYQVRAGPSMRQAVAVMGLRGTPMI